MTDTEIISKIKAEIERRIDAHHTHGHFCAEHEFRDVLSFISTLESEKPVPADLEEPVCEELEEEIARWMSTHLYGKDDKDYDAIKLWGEYIARYFAQWQKEKDYANIPTSLVDRHILDEHWANGRLHGLQEMKDQMMKDAVDGEVCIPNVWVEHKEGKELVVRAEISKGLGFKFGEKVRIIVCKKED